MADLWQAWDAEDVRGSARTIRAFDPEEAARGWAALTDSEGDYVIVDGPEVRVCVAAQGSDEWQTFIVSGRTTADYYARREVES
jgi:hypothetical protein